MREKGQSIAINCKRCGVKMAKWQRSKEDEEAHPFPFDSICGQCITQKEVWIVYPLSKGTYLKK